MKRSLSIILLAQRRPALLQRALDSIFKELHDEEDWELLLVLNGADAAVSAVTEQYRHQRLKILILSSRTPAAARNIAVREASGEVLYFLDDDIELIRNPLPQLRQIFANPLIQVAGGPNLTPPKSSLLGRATGQVLGSFWGAMQMSARYHPRGKTRIVGEEALILCNLACRRDLFREAAFPVPFVCGEENVFLQSLPYKQFLWDPKLAVFHARRDSLKAIFYQMAAYGKGRAQGLEWLPFHRIPIFFLPSLLLLSLPLVPLVLWPYLALAVLAAALRFQEQRDLAASLVQVPLTLFIHLAYGFGFLRGLKACLFPLTSHKV